MQTPDSVVRPSRVRARDVLIASMALTFITMRIVLHASPDVDFYIGAYNIHHLFTGVLLLAVFGIPAVILQPPRRVVAGGYGVGLALALDEWVYLIVTKGSNAEYTLPVSFWSGLALVLIACVYAFVLGARKGGTG